MMRPRRLVVLIYLVCLVQIAVVTLTFFVLRTYVLERPWQKWMVQRARYVMTHVARDLDDPRALSDEVDRVARELNSELAIYDPDGQLLAANSSDPPPPLRREQLIALVEDGSLQYGSPIVVAVPILEHDRLVAYGISIQPQSGGVLKSSLLFFGLAVVGLGIVGFFLGRALERPLGKLARTARAFGGGDLDARVALDRPDELGAVARAFDEMADRVARLVRAQQELLANVSHELRTPLSRMRVALDTAVEGDSVRAQELLPEIEEDLGELEQLVEDVMTTARFDIHGQAAARLRREPIDPTHFLEKAASRFRAAHPTRELSVTAAEGLPTVDGDPALLHRAISNVLENAGKYSEPTTPIALSARRENGSLLVEVRDRGVGIDERDLGEVFVPFFRGDRSRTRATGGAGLGLPIAKRIVEAHGGRIAIESRLGEGTAVRVVLPLLHTSS